MHFKHERTNCILSKGRVIEAANKGIGAPQGRDGSGSVIIYKKPGCPDFSETGVRDQVHVLVRDNNVDQALKALKKKMQREGIFREMKLRRHFEKPSERKAREAAEAVRRARKMERKRLEREGF